MNAPTKLSITVGDDEIRIDLSGLAPKSLKNFMRKNSAWMSWSIDPTGSKNGKEKWYISVNPRACKKDRYGHGALQQILDEFIGLIDIQIRNPGEEYTENIDPFYYG